MRRVENYMKLFIPALSINEGLSRNAVASFVAGLNPTLDELSDIKCAVSEAVTNSIVHGYKYAQGIIYIGVKYYSDRTVIIEVTDKEVIEETLKDMEKTYTKTEINRMPLDELKALATEKGVDGADDMTGGELKKLLIEMFNL